MHYQITHTTRYTYTHPVYLGTQILRLCPRQDGAQWLRSFQVDVTPTPAQQTYWLDASGNTCLKVIFGEPLTEFTVHAQSDVHTTRDNPFDYISEPWAVHFPLDYPSSLASQLAPCLTSPLGTPTPDPAVSQLAQSLAQEVSGHVGFFLTRLTQHIPELCDYQPRLVGPPYAPGITLQKKSGTCRDFTVLFMAICRTMGLAARFVSGYQEGDGHSQETHELHAWAEVYIPGGGWRGFDPTLGLTVADRHVAIAATPFPQQAAPVSGHIRQPATPTQPPPSPTKSQLTTDISLKVIDR